MSNNPDCLVDVPAADLQPLNTPLKEFMSKTCHLEVATKVLGLLYWSSDDTLIFSLSAVMMSWKRLPQETKRSVLSKSASFYDPLGLIAPLILRCKILIRRAWDHRCEWDSPVPPDVQ